MNFQTIAGELFEKYKDSINLLKYVHNCMKEVRKMKIGGEEKKEIVTYAISRMLAYLPRITEEDTQVILPLMGLTIDLVYEIDKTFRKNKLCCYKL